MVAQPHSRLAVLASRCVALTTQSIVTQLALIQGLLCLCLADAVHAASFTAQRVGANDSALAIHQPAEWRLTLNYKTTPLDALTVRVFGEVTPPQGKPFTSEAFYDFGRKGWFWRFTPRQAGVHSIVWQSKIEGQVSKAPAATVQVRDAVIMPGFVKTNRDYFAFNDGDVYFPVGPNLAWVLDDKPKAQFAAYFARMAENKINYVRLWLCTWGITLDGKNPHRIEPAGADLLDDVFRMAMDHGIYIQFCVQNYYDMVHHKDRLFYFSDGQSTEDFFTGSWQQRNFKFRLRYLAARYGHYPNLMAWELFNEINFTGLEEASALSWAEAMAAELRQYDPYQHPVSISFGPGRAVGALMWQKSSMDFTQHHLYFTGTMTDESMLKVIPRLSSGYLKYNKPFMLAEFGFPHGSEKSLHRRDPDGIALHNALWVSLMSRNAGTPANWWWDTYLDPRDLYSHYYAVATFIEPFLTELPQARPFSVRKPGVNILGLGMKNFVAGWVQHGRHTWGDVIEGTRPVKRAPATSFTIEMAPHAKQDGKSYVLRWFDTYHGRWVSEKPVKRVGNRITIPIESVAKDRAFLLLEDDDRKILSSPGDVPPAQAK